MKLSEIVNQSEIKEMDIGAGNGGAAARLSNFAPHPFVVDGIPCNSMEGFLQSLKFKNPEMQKEVCKLVGLKAKFKGKKKKWWRDQTLWWRGNPIDRHSSEYQGLLDMAFDALAENSKFQKTLLSTGNAVFTHSIGKNDESKTVLTTREFVSRLTRIRKRLQDKIT